MFAILHALGMYVADLFKSRSRVCTENRICVDGVIESPIVGSENSIHWIRDLRRIRT